MNDYSFGRIDFCSKDIAAVCKYFDNNQRGHQPLESIERENGSTLNFVVEG